MRRRQRGISFLGMVFAAAVVVVLGLLTVQVVPAYIEYQTIRKAAQYSADAGTTASEIRAAFERARTVQYFDAVEGKDLEILRVDERMVVEFAYAEEIHLFGPAYLVLKFQGRSR